MKPIYLMHEPGFTPLQVGAVLQGIKNVLELGGGSHLVEVENLGVWRQPGFCRKHALVPYQSIDWYLYRAWNGERFNVRVLTYDFINEPWRQVDHHDILAVKSGPLTETGREWFIGAALPRDSAIVSVEPYAELEPKLQRECIITTVMHEVCHIFLTPYEKRGFSLRESFGKHCTNDWCIMRQGLDMVAWVAATKDRLGHGPLCRACRLDLRRYFDGTPR